MTDVTMPDARRAFTLDEVAEMLGVSLSTVLRACDTGELKSIRLRSRRLVLRDAVDRLLASAENPEEAVR